MAGLYAPLPTLRSHPRGGLRTDRGRRGLLLLHRSGLSPRTPCRSPGALTRVAACTLARSPYVVTAIRRLQTLRLLHVCSGRFRLERSPGGACTHWKSAALSRRTWKGDLQHGTHSGVPLSGLKGFAMRVLLTGSSGWLGRFLAPRLRAAGHAAIGLDIVPGAETHVVGSVSERAVVERAFANHGIEAVVHAGALHKP